MQINEKSLADLYLLDSVKGFGPQKFKALFDAGIEPGEVLADPQRLPVEGKVGEKLRDHLCKISEAEITECRKRAARQLVIAQKTGAMILTYRHARYPNWLLRGSHPLPILYVRGNVEVLANPLAVACVGSRRLRPPYDQLHRRFVEVACGRGFAIASGFALGADTAGHERSFEVGGQTVCVMPSGLDRPFPPENKPLWGKLLEYPGAAFVSEFPFGTSAAALTLRKRNKLIVALSLGVLISQSSASGGAMNAFRFAIEQKKPIATFAADGTDDCSGNALIEHETSVPVSTFPIDPDHSRDFEPWLRTLSSSI